MSKFYETLEAKFAKLISKYGRIITYRERVNTGSASNPTFVNVDTMVSAVSSNFNKNDIGSFLVESGDQKFIVSTNVEPSVNDLIIDDGEYSIVDFKSVKPGDTNIIYIIQGRK